MKRYERFDVNTIILCIHMTVCIALHAYIQWRRIGMTVMIASEIAWNGFLLTYF